jgi:hypothetical protein
MAQPGDEELVAASAPPTAARVLDLAGSAELVDYLSRLGFVVTTLDASHIIAPSSSASPAAGTDGHPLEATQRLPYDGATFGAVLVDGAFHRESLLCLLCSAQPKAVPAGVPLFTQQCMPYIRERATTAAPVSPPDGGARWRRPMAARPCPTVPL